MPSYRVTTRLKKAELTIEQVIEADSALDARVEAEAVISDGNFADVEEVLFHTGDFSSKAKKEEE